MAQAIAILGDTDLAALGHNSPTYVHLLTEVIKLTFADREATYGDPRFVDVPITGMLSAAYGARQRARIDSVAGHSRHAAPGGRPGTARTRSRYPLASRRFHPIHRTSLWSIAAAMPSRRHRATPRTDTPIITRDSASARRREARSRSRLEGHPSEVAPGKRPRLTPNPAIAFFDGGMVMPFGSPVGDVQSTVDCCKYCLNLVVFDMDLASVPSRRRAFATYSFPSSFEPHEMLPDRVMLEGRFP
jgi:gamma-glutamyltranspeptidase/glutathione hydrolase